MPTYGPATMLGHLSYSNIALPDANNGQVPGHALSVLTIFDLEWAIAAVCELRELGSSWR